MLDDIGGLDFSPHFCRMLADYFHRASGNYMIAKEIVDWLSWLTYGIYPSCKCFAKTIISPGNIGEKTYSHSKEAVCRATF